MNTPVRLQRLLLAGATTCLAVSFVSCQAVDDSSDAPAQPVEAAAARRFTEHFRALGEDAEFVLEDNGLGGSTKYVVRADGRRQSPGVVQEEERQARLARYGALDPNLAEWLKTRTQSELIPVAVYYRAPVLADDVRRGVRSEQESIRSAATEEMRQKLQTAAEPVASAIHDLGAPDTKIAALMPVIFTELGPEALAQLARHPDVVHILGDLPQEHGSDYSASSAITTPKIDKAMNAKGFFGKGQNVGFLDNPDCALNDKHDALRANTVTYEPQPQICSNDTECAKSCGASADSPHPPSCQKTRDGLKHCVDFHGSTVASAFAASDATDEYGAAEAHIFVPTNGVGSGAARRLRCSQAAMTDAYTWLQAKAVTTVNESWGCDPDLLLPSGSGDGVTQDYYAKTFGMLIVKAAGNDYNKPAWGCRSSNALCVAGLVPGGTATATADINLMLGGGFGSDREDPDVVALSHGVNVMEYTSTTLTNVGAGTSYAAPAMTALSAILKEVCMKEQSIELEQKYARSILMTSAWYYNALDSFSSPNHNKHYSTVNTTGTDFTDGAGGPTADNALLWCGSNVIDLTTGGGTFVVDLTGGDGNPPKHMSGDGNIGGSGFKPSGGKGGEPTSFQGLNFKYYALGTLKDLKQGTRVRITINWDACPAGTTGTGPSALGSDLDLWLCNDTVGKCFSSRSFKNNWEGFDTADNGNVPDAGDWEVRVGYDPTASPGCGGDTNEPLAWAYVFGPGSAFVEFPN